MGELGDRTSIEVRGSDDFVAGGEQRHQRHELGGHSARHGDRSRSVLEGGDALFQHGGRGVAEPRVNVPVLLQLEELRGVVRIIEDERSAV